MRFMIRQIDERAKLTGEIALDALGAALPHAVVNAVMADVGVAERRRRKLPAELELFPSIAMNLFTQDSLEQVLVKLLRGCASSGPTPRVCPRGQCLSASPGGVSERMWDPCHRGRRVLAVSHQRVCRRRAPAALAERRDAADMGSRFSQLYQGAAPAGPRGTLSGLLSAPYVVRRVMHDTALQAGVDPDRLSCINAVRLLCDALPEFQMVAPAHPPQLYQCLLQDIASYRLPARDHRINHRVVKRKMSNFRLKRAQHQPVAATRFDSSRCCRHR
ncbi:MAG: transposase domain-containing protein [Nitrospinae bacterium]|nr:transposase domain-containing protein [Nitrospinota bacterium]